MASVRTNVLLFSVMLQAVLCIDKAPEKKIPTREQEELLKIMRGMNIPKFGGPEGEYFPPPPPPLPRKPHASFTPQSPSHPRNSHSTLGQIPDHVSNDASRHVGNDASHHVNNDASRHVDNDANRRVDNDASRHVDNDASRHVDKDASHHVNNDASRHVDNDANRRVDNDASRHVDNDASRHVDNDANRRVDNDANHHVNNDASHHVNNDASRHLNNDANYHASNEANRQYPRYPPRYQQPNQYHNQNQVLLQENMRLQQRYHEQQVEIFKLRQEIQRLSSIVSGGRDFNHPSNYHRPSFEYPNIVRDSQRPHRPYPNNAHTHSKYKGENFAPPNIVRDSHGPHPYNAHTPSNFEGENFAPPNIVRGSRIPHPPPPPYRQPLYHRLSSHPPSDNSFVHAPPYSPPAWQREQAPSTVVGLHSQEDHQAPSKMAPGGNPPDQAVAEHEISARDIYPELGDVTEEQINELQNELIRRLQSDLVGSTA